MQTVGQLIRLFRTHRGLTLRELSMRACCTAGYLSQIENNRTARPPSESILRRLEEALGTTQGQLINAGELDRLPESLRMELHSLRQSQSHAIRLAELVARMNDDGALPEPARSLSAAITAVNVTGHGVFTDSHPVPVINSPGEPVDVTHLPDGGALRRAMLWISVGIEGATFAMYPPDDSMSPIAFPGDLVVLGGVMDPKPGAWGLVEEKKPAPMTLGIFYSAPGRDRWRIQPANTAWPPRELSRDDIQRVHRPVALIRRLDDAPRCTVRASGGDEIA